MIKFYAFSAKMCWRDTHRPLSGRVLNQFVPFWRLASPLHARRHRSNKARRLIMLHRDRMSLASPINNPHISDSTASPSSIQELTSPSHSTHLCHTNMLSSFRYGEAEADWTPSRYINCSLSPLCQPHQIVRMLPLIIRRECYCTCVLGACVCVWVLGVLVTHVWA